jgi:hypothetical protein
MTPVRAHGARFPDGSVVVYLPPMTDFPAWVADGSPVDWLDAPENALRATETAETPLAGTSVGRHRRTARREPLRGFWARARLWLASIRP